MKNFLILFILSLVFFSCRKDDSSSSEFRFLDIEDANGMLLAKNTTDADTSLRLYKLSHDNNLVRVRYLNAGKQEISKSGVPVAMYNLSGSYFLLSFQTGPNSFETFMIRKLDGKASKLIKPILPSVQGKLDLNIHAIRTNFNSGYYFSDSKGNWLLNIGDINYPRIEEILKGELLGNEFTVDYLGNVLSRDKLFSNSGTVKMLESGGVTNNAFPIKSFVNSMYYGFRKGDSVFFSSVDIRTANITEKRMSPAFRISNASVFINSHAFPESNKIVVVLTDAILVIEGNSVTAANLTSLSLRKIILSDASADYCYIYGENPVNHKVLVRIDFKPAIPVFTQILAPGEVDISNFMVSDKNNLIFTGRRISDSRRLFGFVPLNSNNRILDDDENLEASQVIVR